MLNNEQKQIAQQTLDKYGHIVQMCKTIEELSELIKELSKMIVQTDFKTKDNIILEIADVYIMLYQMSLVFDEEEIKNAIKYKIKRQKDRNNETVE